MKTARLIQIRSLLGVFSTITVSLSAAHAQPPALPPTIPGSAVVLTDNLKLRTAPSLGAPILARMPCNSPIRVLGISADGLWYRAQYQDMTGFAYAKYVGAEGARCGQIANNALDNLTGVTATVRAVRLNVRSAPSLDSEIIGELKRGDAIRVIASTPSRLWLMIAYRGGIAYVYGPYTDFQLIYK